MLPSNALPGRMSVRRSRARQNVSTSCVSAPTIGRAMRVRTSCLLRPTVGATQSLTHRRALPNSTACPKNTIKAITTITPLIGSGTLVTSSPLAAPPVRPKFARQVL